MESGLTTHQLSEELDQQRGSRHAHQQVRDPKDQIFVDLALTARVSALVSGDADLLALNDQFNPMKVLAPAEFHAVVHP